MREKSQVVFQVIFGVTHLGVDKGVKYQGVTSGRIPFHQPFELIKYLSLATIESARLAVLLGSVHIVTAVFTVRHLVSI